VAEIDVLEVWFGPPHRKGGSRSQGGDFYLPFWSDVKKHIVGDADLSEMTDDRIRSNKNFTRLYPLLKDGVIDLLGAKLRWSNEPVHIVPKSVHGNLQFGDIGVSFVYAMPCMPA